MSDYQNPPNYPVAIDVPLSDPNQPQPPQQSLPPGHSQFGEKVRFISICDIACSIILMVPFSAILIWGLMILAKQPALNSSQLSPAFVIGVVVTSIFGLIIYGIDIFCARGLLKASKPVTESLASVTRWIWSQRACIVVEVFLVVYSVATGPFPLSLLPAIFWLWTACRGVTIFLVNKFMEELGGDGSAVVAPISAPPEHVTTSPGGQDVKLEHEEIIP